jgi:putative FmdB family regulatory protein
MAALSGPVYHIGCCGTDITSGTHGVSISADMVRFLRYTANEVNDVPLYEYKCVKCGHRFEKIESVSASETKKCPKCGAKAERVLNAPAIQFKGTGWYVTDYAGKNSDSLSKESKESKEPAEAAKSEDKKSTAKESSKEPVKKTKGKS